MNKAARQALFGVSIVLGFMLSLEAHIDRSSTVAGYTSYLEVSDQLTSALAQTPLLRTAFTRAQQEHTALAATLSHDRLGMTLLRAEALRLDKEAGLTPEAGPGVIITINFDPNLPVIPGLRYVDEATQIQMLVNYLMASGAEAIAINGQRLVTTSSIRSVNGLNEVPGPFSGILQVNEVPVKAPYKVAVIGPAAAIANMLSVEDLAGQFQLLDQSFRLQTFASSHLVRVPGYTGVLPGAYSTEVGE
ncbi:MAG: DUF881 domain-containing protein [Firmicutes bacterium]|nr:DUF881 domain-containing protein [Bacillota bacterium]